MLKTLIVIAAAGSALSVARADITITSVSGISHVDGEVLLQGFDPDVFDSTQQFMALDDIASVDEDAAIGLTTSRATASGSVTLFSSGFYASSASFASAGRHPTTGGSADALGRTDIAVLFSITTTGTLELSGGFSGGMGPGGRSYFGDGLMVLYNPLGTAVLRRSYFATGGGFTATIPAPMPGTWRLDVTSTASAADYGGGGFSGGLVNSSANVAVVMVPAPGGGIIALAGLAMLLRRREP